MDGLNLVYLGNKNLSIKNQHSWNQNEAEQFSEEITERKEVV